jgi:hypothetical protein
MGQMISLVRGAIGELLRLKQQYTELSQRIDESPGIPSEPTTKSFWMDPPFSLLGLLEGDNMPATADIVIIGSGITGISIARKMLNQQNADSKRIVMLEARDLCSGATGR